MKIKQMKEEQLRNVLREARKELKRRKQLNEVDEIYGGAEIADEKFHRELDTFKRQMTRLLNNTVEDIREEAIHDRPASREEVEDKFSFLATRASEIYKDIFGR